MLLFPLKSKSDYKYKSLQYNKSKRKKRKKIKPLLRNRCTKIIL